MRVLHPYFDSSNFRAEQTHTLLVKTTIEAEGFRKENLKVFVEKEPQDFPLRDACQHFVQYAASAAHFAGAKRRRLPYTCLHMVQNATDPPMLRIESEQEQDGRWIAEVPALPGALAYGKTKADAKIKVKLWRCA